jgi:hypothetical protein
MDNPTYISGDGSMYIGKRLSVGITYLTHDGEVHRQEQFHGIIIETSDLGIIIEASDLGIVLERADTGERATLTPGLDEASPGEYRLPSTGEVVVDPDYLAKWTVAAPNVENSRVQCGEDNVR